MKILHMSLTTRKAAPSINALSTLSRLGGTVNTNKLEWLVDSGFRDDGYKY